MLRRYYLLSFSAVIIMFVSRLVFIFSPFPLMINSSPAITYRACPITFRQNFLAAPVWVLVSLIMTQVNINRRNHQKFSLPYLVTSINVVILNHKFFTFHNNQGLYYYTVRIFLFISAPSSTRTEYNNDIIYGDINSRFTSICQGHQGQLIFNDIFFFCKCIWQGFGYCIFF